MTIADARGVRLRRLFRYGSRRLLVVPLDHSVSDGPLLPAASATNALVRTLASNGVDAVVLHKGTVRHVDRRAFIDTNLIIHLSASTARADDPDAKYLVGDVAEALRAGADAVSVHVNLGSRGEASQVRDLATVAQACDQWNVPLLAMVYPRGPRIDNPQDPQLVAHAASLAADLGADIVKLPYVGSVAEMVDVIRACAIPVLVAGGPRVGGVAELLSYVDEALRSGAAGLAMGRNIFQSPDPGRLAMRIAAAVHGPDDGLLRTVEPAEAVGV